MRRSMFAIVILGASLAAAAPAAIAQAQKAPAAAKNVDASKAPARPARASQARATASAPVNLNSATLPQLQTLPGVGASAAQRILDYRQKFGPFKKIEELMNVKGIGEKSFLKLKPLITVTAEKGERAGAQK